MTRSFQRGSHIAPVMGWLPARCASLSRKKRMRGERLECCGPFSPLPLESKEMNGFPSIHAAWLSPWTEEAHLPYGTIWWKSTADRLAWRMLARILLFGSSFSYELRAWFWSLFISALLFLLQRLPSHSFNQTTSSTTKAASCTFCYR